AMVEYRAYIKSHAMVYWFVFRVEKDKFDEFKPQYDSIINSFKVDASPVSSNKAKAEQLAAEGWKLWGQRKLADAEAKFKEAIAADASCENAYQGLGWAQFNQGKNNNAKDSFERCIKLNAENSAALNGLGWIAHGDGKTDEAVQWWEKAVKAQPGATASLSGLCKVYMEKKDYEKAIKYYKMWLKVEPNNQQAKDGLENAKGLLGRENTN
ncbi:MAG: tetratricopeptide repeat protein, partial [Phycisphaerae bacterium]|nr:tetratricopeptide repeat protein [Phycisphaerae bacterium]